MKLSDHKPKRYLLALDLAWKEPDWKEVTKEEYLRAERGAGVLPRFGPDSSAAAFSGNGIRGMVEY